MSKMTDEQIKKTLECCIIDNKKCYCEDCPYKEKVTGFCFDELNKDALNLINRQQAEIERLNYIIARDNQRQTEKGGADNGDRD